MEGITNRIQNELIAVIALPKLGIRICLLSMIRGKIKMVVITIRPKLIAAITFPELASFYLEQIG